MGGSDTSLNIPFCISVTSKSMFKNISEVGKGEI